MSNYQITITRVEPNPEFSRMVSDLEKEKVNFMRSEDYYKGQRIQSIPRDIAVGVLTTELTEEQFKKIQPELVKIFE